MQSFKKSCTHVLILLVSIVMVNVAQAQSIGLSNGKLLPCPGKPNCKVTEYPDDSSRYMAPILLNEIDASYVEPFDNIKRVINKMGGEIKVETPDYIHATFSSFLFRFVDDFEVRIDKQNRIVHIRSASRKGYYDFGANKRRINEFMMLLTGAKEY